MEALKAEPAVVNVVVDNSYPAHKAGTVRRLLDVLPSQTVHVGPGDTLSAVIAREYGLGASDRRLHYRALESEIVRTNGLHGADDLAPGPIAVPILPPWGFAKRSALARLAITSPEIVETAGAVPFGVITSPELEPGGPATTIVTIRTRVDALTPGILADEELIAAHTIPVFLATNGTAQRPSAPLARADRDVLRTRLAAARRTIPLFILDAGWPDEPTWRTSREYLERTSNGIRQQWGFPTISLTAGRRYTRPAHADSDRAHAIGIQSALAELTALSPAVQVIYVPLTKDQEATDVLEELITLGQAIRLALKAKDATRTSLSAAQARGILDHVRSYLPVMMSGISDAPDRVGRIDVNSAVVEGLLWLVSETAEAAGSVAVVNASWTTPADLATVTLPARGRLVILAAVGNVCGLNVHETPVVSLAGNSIDVNSIFAVMTVRGDGEPDCDTSEVAYDNALLGATGYGGTLPDGWCGSSFAAPRVAWYLAAREAIRPVAVNNSRSWIAEVKGGISAASRGPVPRKLLFRPLNYVAP